MSDAVETWQEELERELRVLYDDDDYVLGVLANSRTDDGRMTVLRFIRTAHETGEELTCDDVSLLSLAIADRIEQGRAL